MSKKGAAEKKMEEVPSKNLAAYLSESPWHRNWKLVFPIQCRERSFYSENENCFHRADVHTFCGTTIEFQHSPISLAELQSREAFYPNLVWVVDGKKFKGFKILKHLPDVDDPRLNAYEFSHTQNLTLYRSCELDMPKPKLLTLSHPELFGLKLTTNYFSFVWKHPHRVWYEAKCPMIFDFGGYFLYQLKQREQASGAYAYLEMISRKDFINSFRTIGNL
ncbi:competence protein [Pedobacter xixiisoli]|uniref:Competence protein n=1 Tax=Pedobacter xixiisoli TaxID=1476464 RepID=A0A285ZSF1_9SPHI|nr:competence protein [Pedobacter xixiisoli]SOD12578.1 hypothetical protein SAMN06297358_0741 [Pedobacter xixiisoli]